MMTTLKQPTCPWCGTLPVLSVGNGQAFCGSPECKTVRWDPSLTAVDNMSAAGLLDLEDWRVVGNGR